MTTLVANTKVAKAAIRKLKTAFTRSRPTSQSFSIPMQFSILRCYALRRHENIRSSFGAGVAPQADNRPGARKTPLAGQGPAACCASGRTPPDTKNLIWSGASVNDLIMSANLVAVTANASS
jgi:hypothetical protein